MFISFCFKQLRNSSDAQVMLRRVTLQSTGVYKCEVSGEAPAFNTVSESEIMTVVSKYEMNVLNPTLSQGRKIKKKGNPFKCIKICNKFIPRILQLSYEISLMENN